MAKKKRVAAMILFLIIPIAAATLCYRLAVVKNYKYTYGKTQEILYNPMMGFAPSADNIKAVGRNTLVYVDITWREWEPAEGVYDPASVIQNNNLQRWRQEGKKAVLRFVCDVPGTEAHRDIPDWLYEKTGDGTCYDFAYGKGYSPNYQNQTFIEEHAEAVAALGKEFGQDSFFCFVELGSLGHWGEWHVKYDEGIKRLPGEEVCLAYIKPYINAFPNANILMRRPFEAVTAYNLGVFNDMTGQDDATMEWLGWLEKGGLYEEPEEPLKMVACPSIWETSPVGGEFTSSCSTEELLVTEIDRTVELLRKSHMTFLGPKCPSADGEARDYAEGTALVLKNIGYRYGVSRCAMRYHSFTGKVTLNLVVENSGVAPMYVNWPVYIYLMDEENHILSKIQADVDLTQVTGNGRKRVTVSFPGEDRKGELLSAWIGIEDPDTGEPALSLDMNCENKNNMYRLY